MKLSIIVTVLSVTVGAVAAQPRHMHDHHHRNIERAASQAASQPAVKVVILYELDGRPISAAEVQEGIANGTLEIAPNGKLSSAAIASIPTPVAAQSPKTLAASESAPVVPLTVASASARAYSTLPLSSAAHAAPTTSPVPSTDSGSGSGSSNGLDAIFPDGELDCSAFPAAYGAISLDYLGLGGWSGIQNCEGETSAGFENIETVTSSQCASDGFGCCAEGSYCSYACPPGYQKSQWPTTQGSTGQSIGGVQCKNGKLHLTNPDLSNKLCIPGAQQVSVMVHNTMSDGVAVCRTDYPGTEGETIPLNAAAGTTQNLTCPDASNYYTWKGGRTSAQYYVNPVGVSTQQGCQWGSAGSNMGNFAPLNLGVGYSDGSAWLSIFRNIPTTNSNLDFAVELVGDNGGYDNLNGRCKYENGQYCSGENYKSCDANGNGCTVSVAYGSATFVFSS